MYEMQVRAGAAAGDGAWSATVTGAPAAPAGRLSFSDTRIEDQRSRQHAAIAPLELPATFGCNSRRAASGGPRQDDGYVLVLALLSVF